MRQKRFVIGCVLIVLFPAIGLPSTLVYREFQQQRRNKALIAAIYHNDAQAVVSLLRQGANANTLDDHTPPPTFRQIATQLLNKLRGGHPAPEKEEAHSALLVAVYDYYEQSGMKNNTSENTAVVQALLEHGANMQVRDEIGKFPLWYAVIFQHERLVRLLLAHGDDPNSRDADGMPVLLGIPNGAPVTLTALLLDSGANPNASSTTRVTDLMAECNCEHDQDYAAVKLLLEQGADANLQDWQGETALMSAADHNNIAIVRLLLAHKAKVSIKDKKGHTALDRARNSHNAELVRLLKQAIEKP